MACFSQRLVADEQGLSCGVDNLGCEPGEVVDRLHAFDLGQQPVDEAEVPAGDPDDSRNGCRVGETAVGCVVLCREASGQDGGEFLRGELVVFVGEADAAVELRVAGQTFFDPGHPDEDDPHGVHGGAGESAVTRLIDGSRSTQHAWPAFEDAGMPPRVLLVCRSNRDGLESARRALIEWTSPQPPVVELLGLAVLADAPGKLPKELRDLETIVGGGAPRLWHLPWVDAWRTGDVAPEQLPRETRKFITEVNSLLP